MVIHVARTSTYSSYITGGLYDSTRDGRGLIQTGRSKNVCGRKSDMILAKDLRVKVGTI